MVRDMCADVKMEEGYMRTVIEYGSQDSKVKIEDAISKIEKETNLFPIVIRKAMNSDAGNISIEFELGGCHRDGGVFTEALLKLLNIKVSDI